MERIKLDMEKVRALPKASDYLDKKYGKKGTPTRIQFDAEAYRSVYGDVIRETRKEKGITQEQLAQILGKKRPYISRIERGISDIQVSNFLQILSALGLGFEITN